MAGTPPLEKLISEQTALCAECLWAKCGVRVRDVKAMPTISLKRDIAGLCAACQSWTLVFTLGKSVTR